jgi:hypothetical protein
MSKYLSTLQIQLTPSQCKFHFEGCKSPIDPMPPNPNPNLIHVQIPFRDLVFLIPLKDSLEIARHHGMDLGSHATKALIQTSFLNHYCPICLYSISMFSLVFPKNKTKQNTDCEHVRALTCLRVQRHRQKLNNQKIALQNSSSPTPQPTNQPWQPVPPNLQSKHTAPNIHPHLNQNIKPIMPDLSAPPPHVGDCETTNKFPPEPLSPETTLRVITSACHNMTPQMLEESGCAVCGQLTKRCQLLQMESIHENLSVLSVILQRMLV